MVGAMYGTSWFCSGVAGAAAPASVVELGLVAEGKTSKGVFLAVKLAESGCRKFEGGNEIHLMADEVVLGLHLSENHDVHFAIHSGFDNNDLKGFLLGLKLRAQVHFRNNIGFDMMRKHVCVVSRLLHE